MPTESLVVLDKPEEKTAPVELTDEEKALAWQEEQKTLILRYVAPSPIKSREVTEADIERVREEAIIMHKLCFVRHGQFPSAFAIAHTQICNEDPLNMFTTREGLTVINPKITRHTSALVYALEGCMSFPDAQQALAGRWYKIEAEYDILVKDNDIYKFKKQIAKLKGLEARIFQHEYLHLLGKYCHDKDLNEFYKTLT